MKSLSIKEIVAAVGGTLICGNEEEEILQVSTNSKNLEKGALFIPIIGEKVDAHDFIEDAFHNGAKATFTSKQVEIVKDRIYIKVDDTLNALQLLGTYYRSLFNIPIIGITGSVGKTTTKEMVACALQTKYNVLKTEGNMNSQVGLPLMMLRIEPYHEIAVIEMGMSEVGEMARLTGIAKPETAIMTNIGVSHIAQLKTRENIRKEKLNIINAFHENSVLFINGDDDLLFDLSESLTDMKKEEDIKIDSIKDYKNSQNSDKMIISHESFEKLIQTKVTTYGTNDCCEYRAENIKVINEDTHFTLTKQLGDENLKEEIVLQVLGIHNVYNALAALAVSEHYNIKLSDAKKGLYQYKPIAMRGQIKEANKIKIIDDSYNASPDSMKSGIEVLLELQGVKRRIAVLADVKELGEVSKQCHYEVGLYIAGVHVDELITIGTDAYYIAKAVNETNANIITHSFQNNIEAINYLKDTLKPEDGVLVKGSRSMKTDEIVKAFVD